MSKMRLIAGLVGLTALSATANHTRADDGKAEATLAAKGLVRAGKYYLLPKVEDAIQRLGLAKTLEAGGMRDEFEPPPPPPDGPMGRFGPRPGFDFGPGGPGGPGSRNRPGRQEDVQMIERLGRLGDNELVDALIAGKSGIERLDPRRREAVCIFLRDKLLDRYNRLAADPQVVAALKELNKGRDPKFAVGPRPSYNSRVIAAAAETLGAKTLKIVKGTVTFTLAIDDDAIKRALEIEKLASRLRQLERAFEDAKVNKNGKKDDPERAFAAFVAQRRVYVERARDLGRLVDEAKRLHQALRDDPEVRDAFADLDKYRASRQKYRLVTKKLDEAVRRLVAIDETIAAERIALKPDRGMAWVETILNAHNNTLMVVDPETPFVRLSAKSAIALGVSLDDASPIVSTADDGRTFPAKRITLKSLRVGSIVVNKVDCVVMPDSFGDSPPLLGASFLDRFVADVDAASANLTLARVNFPQSTGGAKVGGK